jgi:hypothetical protein
MMGLTKGRDTRPKKKGDMRIANSTKYNNTHTTLLAFFAKKNTTTLLAFFLLNI